MLQLKTIERIDIQYLLACFRDMGADNEQIEAEYQKLLDDVNYCDNWLKSTGFFK